MNMQEALDQVAYLQKLVAQTRLRAADGYPFFLLWGLLWIAGYAGSIRWSQGVWAIIAPVGVLLSVVLVLKKRREQPSAAEKNRLGNVDFIYLHCVFIRSIAAHFG